MVGTDFSDGARDALGYAMRLAKDLGARVALVHAYEEAPSLRPEDDPTPGLLVQLAQEIVLSRPHEPGVLRRDARAPRTTLGEDPERRHGIRRRAACRGSQGPERRDARIATR